MTFESTRSCRALAWSVRLVLSLGIFLSFWFMVVVWFTSPPMSWPMPCPLPPPCAKAGDARTRSPKARTFSDVVMVRSPLRLAEIRAVAWERGPGPSRVLFRQAFPSATIGHRADRGCAQKHKLNLEQISLALNQDVMPANAGIHVFLPALRRERRGWPGQARP